LAPLYRQDYVLVLLLTARSRQQPLPLVFAGEQRREAGAFPKYLHAVHRVARRSSAGVFRVVRSFFRGYHAEFGQAGRERVTSRVGDVGCDGCLRSWCCTTVARSATTVHPG
jgi:hypothetical protein